MKKVKQKQLIVIIAVIIAVAAIAALAVNKSKRAHDRALIGQEEAVTPAGPAFNADSAFAFVKQQCDFGARTMNSEAHERCKEWIIEKFKQYGCKVTTQAADLKGYDGTVLHSTNIMAQYAPERPVRILLCAHYDSRPWADNDPDSANGRKPIDGANDGASGVAVMLEIARLLQQNATPTVGVDFVCFDAEDWGTPQWEENAAGDDTWALGSQYWSKHLPDGYTARYGILLDMVGGQQAQFYKEGMSMRYAADVVDHVWNIAHSIGYGSYFPRQTGGWVNDDHVPVNQYAGIPTIDIIPYHPHCAQSTFGPTWHTLDDNIKNIDPKTLKAVGQTLLHVIFTEQ